MKKLSETERVAATRTLCVTDLYFLLRYVLKRADIEKKWLFDRCREVQSEPDGHLDLWAREHYKSTIITFGLTVQDILKDPEVTIGIFSHTRPIAKGFLRQIKREFESNETLKALFPDILWANPQKDSPKWSEDDGIIVKRRSNPKEATIEAWGLVDGQPTSKHYKKLIYDDVVTRESVTTPDMIHKTTEAWELSTNLGAEGGTMRFIGTRYHANDTYRELIKRGSVQVRKHAATVDGSPDGEPVLLTAERLAQKRRDQGPYTFACQMLQDPVADETQGFKRDWINTYDITPNTGSLNVYILCDPANGKRKDNDYTSMWVIGLGSDNNYYVLDMLRDRLNLTERGDALFSLHRRWKPKAVGYEQYSMQADIQHFQERMKRETYRFDIRPLGGKISKVDRIRRLIPSFEQMRWWFPGSIVKTNYEGRQVDLVSTFIEEEFAAFPVSIHDDMLDALARIDDPDFPVIWPKGADDKINDRYARPKKRNLHGARTWASA